MKSFCEEKFSLRIKKYLQFLILQKKSFIEYFVIEKSFNRKFSQKVDVGFCLISKNVLL